MKLCKETVQTKWRWDPSFLSNLAGLGTSTIFKPMDGNVPILGYAVVQKEFLAPYCTADSCHFAFALWS